MKSKKENLDYIEDIIDSIYKLKTFIKGINEEEFIKDHKTNYAVVRCIEIIGEASKNITENIKMKYNNIPWDLITDTRNFYAHNYESIDLEIVWKTVNDDIPVLLKNISKIKIDIELIQKKDRGTER